MGGLWRRISIAMQARRADAATDDDIDLEREQVAQ
jgi:hypothetical protein